MAALFDAHRDRERMANFRSGLLATIFYNQNRRKGSKVIEPLEWFGDKPPKPVQTAEEVRQQLTAWAAVVNRK